MKISVIFLGTGAVIPTVLRNHSSILLSYKTEKILIDCGEGTQRQFRKAKVNPCKLTRILITHWHGDHILGLPGLFQTLGQNNYNKILHIYGPKGTKKYIEEILRVFVPTKKIKIEVNEVSGKFLETPEFSVSAVKLKHDIPCNGYIFQEKEKIRIDKSKLKKLKIKNSKELSILAKGKNAKINGRLIKAKEVTYKQKGRKISIILDTKLCSEINQLAKDSDLAIIESTYLKRDENFAREYKHLTAEQAAKIAKSQKVKQLILTHISQRYEHEGDSFLKEAKKIFKNTKLANDFMKVEI